MAHLDEEVAVVAVEEVPRDAGALRLPVQPGPERAVVDAVVADDDVDGRVELDAGDLVAVELALEGDVVDVVVLDRREHAAEVADDAVLAAVVDGVAADDVRADVLPVPADLAGGEHRLELVLVAGLVLARGRVVVARRGLLAERDGRALRVVDDVVLDDPALRPVRPDEAGLVGGRRGPGRRGVRQLEAAHGDVVDVVLGGVEDRPAHVDLDELLRSGRRPGSSPRSSSRRRPPRRTRRSGSARGRGCGRASPVQSSRTSVRSGGSETSSPAHHLVEALPVQVHVAEVLPRGRLLGDRRSSRPRSPPRTG